MAVDDFLGWRMIGSRPWGSKHVAVEPESLPANNPTLLAAAGAVEALTRDSFAGCYGGTVLGHSRHTMTVYRRAGCGLDVRVRQRVPGVTVVFRDARMSEQEMLASAQRNHGRLRRTRRWPGPGWRP